MKVICERALNFERVVFYLLVLLLPTQFGKHFWPAFSQVLGIRIDYLSPTLYTTDLLIFTLFALWLKRHPLSLPLSPFRSFSSFPSPFRRGQGEVQGNIKKVVKSLLFQIPNFKYQWLIFFFYLFLTILFSGNPLLGLYGFGKTLELFFLGYYVSQNIKTKKEFTIIAAIFSITVIGESFLAIAQYLRHGSINGLLYFLGERKFTSLTPGIANASINGELILRPYGTFPHPNVLAGFLLCALVIIFSWFDENKFILSICHSGKRSASRILTSRDSGQARMTALYIMNKILKTTALLLGSLALFLTLSRIAILLWFILMVIIVINYVRALPTFVIPSEERVEESHTTKLGKKVFLLDLLNTLRSLRFGRFRRPTVGMTLCNRNWLFKQIKIRKKTSVIYFVYFLLTAGIAIVVLFYIPVLPRFEGTNFTEEAFSQRADLFKSTLIMIKDHPLFGVGLYNFLPSLSHIQKPLSPTLYLQPVHNIFLLITAEIGIIGLAFLLWFLFKTYNRLLFYLSLRGRTELMRRSPLASSVERDKGVRLKSTKQSPAVLLILLSVILILGLFDHYWLTLQQGQLLFALILGLSWAL